MVYVTFRPPKKMRNSCNDILL